MSKKITVFMNGDVRYQCEVMVHSHRTLKDILADCKEQLNVSRHTKVKLFDSIGGELSDDDLEYLNAEEPLFLSRGEEFSKNSSIAIYQEIEKLGEGGFGSVWLYQHKISKDSVAIKFIELGSLNSIEDVNRVYSEISVLRNLKHPNIVQLVDAFPLNDKIGFVMEYCSGGELAEYLTATGPLPEMEVYSVACQMADAIRYCHSSSIVHRDLKLENLMFSDKSCSHIKVVDFGIAGMLAGGGERSNAGSLLYVAPEVVSGTDNRANPALDVWSMGVILYVLLTNKQPFLENTENAVVGKIISGKYPKLPNSISLPWHRLMKGMLRTNPLRRWDVLRVSEHLFKHRACVDAPLTDDSLEEQPEERKAPPRPKVRGKGKPSASPNKGRIAVNKRSPSK